MKTKRLCRGHYEFSHKGHRIEIIHLQLHGDKGWIAPCDGSNDQELLPTKREAIAQAIFNIDYEEMIKDRSKTCSHG